MPERVIAALGNGNSRSMPVTACQEHHVPLDCCHTYTRHRLQRVHVQQQANLPTLMSREFGRAANDDRQTYAWDC